MSELKKRVLVGILGLALTFGLAACSKGDGPSNTTPGDTTTTEPLGS